MKHLTNQKTAPIVKAVFIFAFYFLSCYNLFTKIFKTPNRLYSFYFLKKYSLFGANCQSIYFEEAVFMAMKKLPVVEIQGVRGYVDKNNVAWLNAEDIARKLGFVDYQEKVSATSGRKTYEVIRWARINGYLREFEPLVKGTEISALLSKGVGAGDYIAENLFYLLAMKANNEAARDFQWKVASEILPSIRRDGFYSVHEAEMQDMELEKKNMADEHVRLENERTKFELARQRLEIECAKFELDRQRLENDIIEQRVAIASKLHEFAMETKDDKFYKEIMWHAIGILINKNL